MFEHINRTPLYSTQQVIIFNDKIPDTTTLLKDVKKSKEIIGTVTPDKLITDIEIYQNTLLRTDKYVSHQTQSTPTETLTPTDIPTPSPTFPPILTEIPSIKPTNPYNINSPKESNSIDDDADDSMELEIFLKYGIGPILASLLGLGSISLICKLKYSSKEGWNFCLQICPKKNFKKKRNNTFLLTSTPMKDLNTMRSEKQKKKIQETSFIEMADESNSTYTTSVSTSRERSPESPSPRPQQSPPPPPIYAQCEGSSKGKKQIVPPPIPPRKIITRSSKNKNLVELDINAPVNQPVAKTFTPSNGNCATTTVVAEIHPILDFSFRKPDDTSYETPPTHPIRVEDLYEVSSGSSSYHDTSASNDLALTPESTARGVVEQISDRKTRGRSATK